MLLVTLFSCRTGEGVLERIGPATISDVPSTSPVEESDAPLPPDGSEATTGSPTGDTGAPIGACAGDAPAIDWYEDQYAVPSAPITASVAAVTGGTVCDVVCTDTWLTGRWVVPGTLETSPSALGDDSAELILEIEHRAGLHDAICYAAVGDDFILEVAVRQ